MLKIFKIVAESQQVDLVSPAELLDLMERPDFVAFIGRIRHSMAKVKDSHRELVGAAGFEPTTSLEFRQGALTAELHAYFG